jgi:hypothetical protein
MLCQLIGVWQRLPAEQPHRHGVKFSSFGNGPTLGTPDSGPGPSEAMTESPSEAKNSVA